jgi:hypothetical protein
LKLAGNWGIVAIAERVTRRAACGASELKRLLGFELPEARHLIWVKICSPIKLTHE